MKLAPISPAWSTLIIFSSILRLSWSSHSVWWLEDESLTNLVSLLLFCSEQSKMCANLLLPWGIKALMVMFWTACIVSLISDALSKHFSQENAFRKLSACLLLSVHLVWHAQFQNTLQSSRNISKEKRIKHHWNQWLTFNAFGLRTTMPVCRLCVKKMLHIDCEQLLGRLHTFNE